MKNKRFFESLSHAIDGVKTLIKEERNMRFHLVMTVLVIFCAVIFNLTALEKVIVIFLCAAVIGAELINTAVENTVNICAPTFNMFAKKAKDLASGAVLVISLGAAICGLIIFVPYGLALLEKILNL